jgi:hypothetical protein
MVANPLRLEFQYTIKYSISQNYLFIVTQLHILVPYLYHHQATVKKTL